MGDPIWLEEERLSGAKVWEQRCREQLKRAQDAEDELERAKKRIRELERSHPLAAGGTPVDAAMRFAEQQWPGEAVTRVKVQESREGLFRVRCYVDGTSMKIDGYILHGVYLVTGWI